MAKRKPVSRERASMSSSEVLDRLETRHSEEVTVRECKSGPSQGTQHVRMDLWCFRKSWSSPCLTAYEVKVSRSDFLGDKKWPAYLPLCNELFFACPANLIQPEEMPEHVGLVWAYDTPARVITKKRATHRQIPDPVLVYQYVLMCRTTIEREHWSGKDKADRAAFWRQWLADRGQLKDVGYKVSRALREQYASDVVEVTTTNHRLQKEIEKYADLVKFLNEQGLSIHGWRANEAVADVLRCVPTDLASSVESAIRGLNTLQRELASLADARKLPKQKKRVAR